MEIDPIIKEKKILIGASAGPDSTALIYLFLRSQFDPKQLVIAHVNYHLRGKDSLEDENFIKNLAEKLSIRSRIKKIEMNTEVSNIQDWARNERYTFFSSLKNEMNLDYIATGHQMEDQVETFFLHLLRGSGLSGLSAMHLKENDKIRPLLRVKKNKILQWLNENQIDFRTDDSNLQTKYQRNKIRHQLLPLLTQLNSKSIEHIAHTTAIVKNVVDHLSETLTDDLKKHLIVNSKYLIKVENQWIRNTTYNSRTEIFKYLINLLEDLDDQPLNLQLTSHDLNQINQYFKEKRSFSYQIQKKIFVHKDADYFYLSPYSIEKKSIPISVPGEYQFLNYTVKLGLKGIDQISKDQYLSPSKCQFYLDFEKIRFPLILTNDYAKKKIQPVFRNQTIKLSNHLKKMRLVLLEKRILPYIISDDECLCYQNGIINDKYKISPETQKVLEIKFKERT